jgi:F-type H+-transporting ATPase subunit delta
MVLTKVSIKYAASLLESSFEKKIDQQIADESQSVLKVISQNPLLNKVLRNPIIKSEAKLNILEDIFKDKVSTDMFDFITFIVKKNREDILHDILSKYIELRNDRLGIVNVEVISSAEFDRKQVEELQLQLEKMLNKKVIVSFKLDNSVIGGFIAKAGDTIIDASLKHQLEELRKQFFKSGIALN